MNYLYLFLISLIFFTSCASKQENKQEATAKDSSEKASIPDTSNQVPVIRQTEYLTGVIGKNLLIEMTMIFVDDSIKGRYRYQKKDDFLTIKGIKAGQILQFQEYDPEGNTTGFFEGVLNDDSTVTGKWKNISGSRSLNFSLQSKNSMVSNGSATIFTKTENLYDGKCACAKIMLPVVSGNLYPEKLSAVNKLLSQESILGGDICTCNDNMPMGVVAGSFEVLYNKNNLLSICYYVETMGAYPGGYSKYLNINLNTGNYIKAKEIFKKEAMQQIKDRINKKLDQYFNEALSEMETEDDKEYLKEYKGGEMTEEGLENFLITKDGIVFYYNWGLPHVIQAWSPAGEVPLSFAEISDWVKEEGILGFVAK